MRSAPRCRGASPRGVRRRRARAPPPGRLRQSPGRARGLARAAAGRRRPRDLRHGAVPPPAARHAHRGARAGRRRRLPRRPACPDPALLVRAEHPALPRGAPGAHPRRAGRLDARSEPARAPAGLRGHAPAPALGAAAPGDRRRSHADPAPARSAPRRSRTWPSRSSPSGSTAGRRRGCAWPGTRRAPCARRATPTPAAPRRAPSPPARPRWCRAGAPGWARGSRCDSTPRARTTPASAASRCW